MLLTTEDIQGQNIWYNSRILKDRKPFLYSNYMNFLIFIYGLLDNEGNIQTFETYRNKYQIKTNLHYASLVNAIKSLSSGGIAPNQMIARSEFEVHHQMCKE